MKSLIILCAISAVLGMAVKNDSNQEWQKWKETHQKNYLNMEEENYRREVWEKNLNYVNIHNSRLDKQFTLHMNQFADRDNMKRHGQQQENVNSQSGDSVPTNFDWRQKGVIGPVTNEGLMGNDNAIVAAETLASLHAVQTGQLYDLSVYETIVCGCGAQLFITDIFVCIKTKIGGLCTKEDYKMKPSGSCHKDSCKAVAKVNGSVFIKNGDEDEMGKAILKTPLMAYVDASHPSFDLYTGGVYSDTDCDPSRIDHPLQIVGYGEVNKTQYWICKNSWGEEWGNKGYIWIERGKNMCGIATMAVYPY